MKVLPELRPCLICHGTNPQDCLAYQGTGTFPYPWILPEDEPIRKLWTEEETETIYDAPTGQEAYYRYCFVYGSTERTQSSVYRHWQYVNKHEVKRPYWSEPEIQLLEEASDAQQAVVSYRIEYGTARTDKAIRMKFWRLGK